jgi:hypothetical protein
LGLCPASLTRVGCGPDATDAEDDDDAGCWSWPAGTPEALPVVVAVVVVVVGGGGGTARENCCPCRKADELTEIPEYTDDPSLLLLTVLPPPPPPPDRLDRSAPALALADCDVAWYWCDDVGAFADPDAVAVAAPRGDDAGMDPGC